MSETEAPRDVESEPPRVHIDVVAAWDGFTVEWHDGATVLLSRRRHLYAARTDDPRPRYLASVPESPRRRALARWRLGQRALRAMFYNVVPLGDERWFVCFGRRVGILSAGGWHELRLRQPARIMRGGVARSPDGALWFGEYFDNGDRRPVHVYRWAPGDHALTVVHTFARGEIYHVHSVTWDPYRVGLICCVGDRGAECRILLTRDGFATVEAIGAGSEDWRAVSIVPTADAWLYGTDAEFQQNSIVHVDAASRARTVVALVEGPVYFCRAWGQQLLFSVTAERCEIMRTPEAVLWCVDGRRAVPLVRFEKDLGHARWIWRVFLPGTLHFPLGPGHRDQTFVSGTALRGLDARVLSIRR
ncbi:MAG: hypothetical protein K2X99_10975 [Gemmatimonadaceae bacterium]|nr:hypothetical protein [Gemmatimonadaceae bacterium]